MRSASIQINWYLWHHVIKSSPQLHPILQSWSHDYGVLFTKRSRLFLYYSLGVWNMVLTCCNKQNIQVLWSQCDVLNNIVNKRERFNNLFYDGIDTIHVDTFKNIFTGILRTQILLTLHKIVTFLLWSSSNWLWLNYSTLQNNTSPNTL